MKPIIYLTSFLAIIAGLGASSAFAHHSNAPHFDNDIEIVKTGVVTQWKFVNPHAYLYFEVKNDDETTTTWRCETEAATALRRRGYTNETFLPGETITVTGNPARREDNSCFTRDFILADGTVIDRRTILTGETTDPSGTQPTERQATLPSGEPNISGFWWDGDTPPPAGASGPPPGGGMTGMGMGSPARLARLADIALTPAGEEQLAKYEFIYDDPSLHCKIANIMDGMGRDESVSEIRQNGNTITILYGYMDYLRTIHMDVDSHPDNLTLTSGGHSYGKWEGETLVVNSFGFLPSVLHPRTGIPTSDQLRIVERFEYDHQAQELIREYVATDPVYLNEEFKGNDTFTISDRPYEPYNCEPLSGLNNLRPGTPEYEAELKKLEEEQTEKP